MSIKILQDLVKVVQKSKSKLKRDGSSNLKILRHTLLIKDLELKKYKQLLLLILISPLNQTMEIIKRKVSLHLGISCKDIKQMNSIVSCRKKVVKWEAH